MNPICENCGKRMVVNNAEFTIVPNERGIRTFEFVFRCWRCSTVKFVDIRTVQGEKNLKEEWRQVNQLPRDEFNRINSQD